MIKLSNNEKEKICGELAVHLNKLRKLLNLNQEDFSSISGISRVTISQIEGGKVKMTWLHLNAILCVFNANIRTKEYLYANNLLGLRYLQFIQHLDEDQYPEYNIDVDLNKAKLCNLPSIDQMALEIKLSDSLS